MAEPRKPNFMKLSISRDAARPKGPEPTTEEEKAAAERQAAAGGVLGGPGTGTGTGTLAGAHAGTGTGTTEPGTLLVRADEAAAAIRAALAPSPAPRIAVILGSGLGGFADGLEGARFVDYAAVPHFPRSTVVGHRGRLGFGRCSGVPLFAMQGRFHYYEGYALGEVTFPVRVLGRLGVRLLVVTNAAGGIGDGLGAGDLMVMDDHLNLMGVNPLRGPHDPAFGARFPDMSEVYGARWKEALRAAAAAEGIALKSGVYAALPGPSYETPAEIRMLAKLGADAVGMSTVPEAIVASQMGLGVLGISGIANMAAGIVRGHRLTHQEVVETMDRIGGVFARLLAAAMPRLAAALEGSGTGTGTPAP